MDLEPFHIPSADSDDQPASRRLLKLVATELRAEIRALDAKFDSRFTALEGKIEITMREMRAELARQGVLLEEQNSNNRIVLEGLQAVWQRQDRIEKAINQV